MQPNEFDDFLKFRRMITPVIIQIIFWVGVVVSVVSGLGMIFAGISNSYVGGSGVLMGLLVVVVGPIATRIWCELVILFFRMNETLTDISNGMKAPVQQIPPYVG